ncbi:Uncharacterised protein [Bordetella pertussis]|nr:Uncharacterised protein [Bordetella pertussis]
MGCASSMENPTMPAITTRTANPSLIRSAVLVTVSMLVLDILRHEPAVNAQLAILSGGWQGQ